MYLQYIPHIQIIYGKHECLNGMRKGTQWRLKNFLIFKSFSCDVQIARSNWRGQLQGVENKWQRCQLQGNLRP